MSGSGSEPQIEVSQTSRKDHTEALTTTYNRVTLRPPMRVHFELTKPVAAIVGFEDSEIDAFADLVGSVVVGHDFDVLARPWDEIDIAIVNHSIDDDVPAVTPVLYRTINEIEPVDYRFYGLDDSVRLKQSITSAVIVLWEPTESDALNDQIAELVSTFPDGDRRHLRTGPQGEWIRAFVTNRRDETLCGEYRRSGEALGWVLPYHSPVSPSWLRLFLQRIHEDDPERVPKPPADWELWDTAEVERLRAKRKDLYDEARSVLEKYNVELSALDETIVETKERDDTSGLGLLLKADGKQLKDAVFEALGALDFDVTDVDESLDDGEGKREDLWIHHDEKVVIVEVKGYSKGARLRDLMRAKDYKLLYFEKHRSNADAQWHIVNANRGRQPYARSRLFEGHDDAVEGFGGLVIDTRDLFRLVRDVQRGELTQDGAKDLLWTPEPGLFRYPAEETGGSDQKLSDG